MDTKQTLFASALAAIGASLCCVAPLVLVTLGIGGAWMTTLTQLEPVRPVFVVLALGLLALAWRKLYRSSTACAPGKRCADIAVLHRQRVIFWLVAIPLLLLLAFPLYAALFYWGDRMNPSISLAALLAALSAPCLAAQKMVTLDVPGMRCAACPITVKKALTRVDGVSRAEVDYDKRQASVTFDDARVSVDQLSRATAEAGYPSSVRGGGK